MSHPHANPVLQLRLILDVEDFEEAVAFYRDALGLTEQVAFEGEHDARVAILEAGRATLELANPAQRELIDGVEVGHRTAPRVRVAFEVPDTERGVRTLVEAGARLLASPVTTPWRSRNARLEAPGDVQLTLFQELTDLSERSALDGFGTAERRHGD
jgi:catechol 2,3-dioxygenase-like lactoylglutathione lyase family enzyme